MNYFLKKFAKEQQVPPRSIAPAALKALEKYHWPGNVRELENFIRRALVVAKGPGHPAGDLPAEVTGHVNVRRGPSAGRAAIGAEPAGTDPAALARQLFQWARRDPKLKIIPPWNASWSSRR